MAYGIYGDGTYRDNNPDWHVADSKWKAGRVESILARNSVQFSTCVEVGCGAGKILQHLARQAPNKHFEGYDVSPDAACRWDRESHPTVSYQVGDFTVSSKRYDLLLLIDVLEHVEDYLGFLRKLSGRADWFVFHVPLEMHVSGILRDRQLHARKQVGHIHYFSRATALATFEDAGLRVVDHEYTRLSQETLDGRRALTHLANVVRRAIQAISPDVAAKLLGGYSLLVLCRSGTGQ